MKTSSPVRSSMTTTDQLTARLVLMEEGSSPEALLEADDGPGTTLVVGTTSATLPELARRVEHRISLAQHSAQKIAEVLFLLGPSSGEQPCTRRLATLHAVMRCLPGTDVDIVLVPPSNASPELRNEVFALADFLVSQGASGDRRVRVTTNGPRRASGTFVSSGAVRNDALRAALSE
jgi:hypothetical protein